MTIRKTMLGLGLALCSGAVDAAGEPSLDWLAGRWCNDDGDRRIDEAWFPQAGGVLLGMSRTTRAGKPESFEFMRIAVEGKLATLHVQPGGAPAVVFTQAARGERWIRFEAPEHDFPNRIEYRAEGEGLNAWIAGPGPDGKELRIPFDYRRCGD